MAAPTGRPREDALERAVVMLRNIPSIVCKRIERVIADSAGSNDAARLAFPPRAARREVAYPPRVDGDRRAGIESP